jgi:hypothetical protein
MDTVKINIYKFSELSDKAKEKAIELWYESEEYPMLSDDIKEDLSQIDSYFEDTKLEYSLSYSQGDGLSFSGDFILSKWIKDNNDKYKLSDEEIDSIIESTSVWSKGNDGRYAYASESDIDFETTFEDCDLSDQIEGIVMDIRKYYIDICDKLEKYGYDIIEYRMTEDEFNDHCESNDYRFYASGKMYSDLDF